MKKSFWKDEGLLRVHLRDVVSAEKKKKSKQFKVLFKLKL